ncbi:hypothetical protein [Methylophaga sp.]|uniref:hypothetical protein n=1 Tax=Methylophaga sp. TaxID=2024840 RepID=UPI003F69D6CC
MLNLASSSTTSNIYLAAQLEKSKHSQNYLAGLGLDLNISHFDYFQLNFYHRENENLSSNFQLTPVWSLPFIIGQQKLLFDGFIDWSSSSSDAEYSINFTPQLKWDIGPAMGVSKRLYLGIEYTYWKNTYNLNNTTESNIKFLIKFHN